MPQEEIRKSHADYKIQIFILSCKYEYNIFNKHLKQAPQNWWTQKQSIKKTNHIRHNSTTINSHTTLKHELLTSDAKSYHILLLVIDITEIN